MGGVGGTLAGNALSLAAVRATLGEVLTDEAFAGMVALGERLAAGVEAAIAAAGVRLARDAARLPRRVPLPAAARRETAASRRARATRSSSASSTSTRSTAACS